MAKLRTPRMKGMKLNRHVGKGAVEQRLPSRHAMQTLTGGSQLDRSMNNYSKQTPSMNNSMPMGMMGMNPGESDADDGG